MSYERSQAAREFTKWSEHYDQSILQWMLFGPSHRAILHRVRRRFGEGPIRVLDVGCGTGVFAAKIREALPSARVWGLDLVSGMLAKARERWRHHAGAIQPVQGDSERLPFASGSFDAVTCANSFHHYPHQDRAIAEFHRVLRPNGRVFLVDGYRDMPLGWFIYDVCVASFEGAVQHASARRMRGLFADAHFGDISQSVHRLGAPFLLTEAAAHVAAVRSASEQSPATRGRSVAVHAKGPQEIGRA